MFIKGALSLVGGKSQNKEKLTYPRNKLLSVKVGIVKGRFLKQFWHLIKTFMLKLFDSYKIWPFKRIQNSITGHIMKIIPYLSALDKMIRKPAGPDLVVFIIGALY